MRAHLRVLRVSRQVRRHVLRVQGARARGRVLLRVLTPTRRDPAQRSAAQCTRAVSIRLVIHAIRTCSDLRLPRAESEPAACTHACMPMRSVHAHPGAARASDAAVAHACTPALAPATAPLCVRVPGRRSRLDPCRAVGGPHMVARSASDVADFLDRAQDRSPAQRMQLVRTFMDRVSILAVSPSSERDSRVQHGYSLEWYPSFATPASFDVPGVKSLTRTSGNSRSRDGSNCDNAAASRTNSGSL
jgi:hypothetical protein